MMAKHLWCGFFAVCILGFLTKHNRASTAYVSPVSETVSFFFFTPQNPRILHDFWGQTGRNRQFKHQTLAQERNVTQKEQPMTEGNFWGCGKMHALDWLFLLGYVPFLELRFMLKLSNIHMECVGAGWPPYFVAYSGRKAEFQGGHLLTPWHNTIEPWFSHIRAVLFFQKEIQAKIYFSDNRNTGKMIHRSHSLWNFLKCDTHLRSRFAKGQLQAVWSRLFKGNILFFPVLSLKTENESRSKMHDLVRETCKFWTDLASLIMPLNVTNLRTCLYDWRVNPYFLFHECLEVYRTNSMFMMF